MGNLRRWHPKYVNRRVWRPNPVTEIPLGDINLDKVKIKRVLWEGGRDETEYGWDPQQRPIKEISRHIVAKASKKNKKHLLVLPGSTGRDIDLLRHYKVASKQSKWTLIEKESKYRTLLKQQGLFSDYSNVLDHEGHFNSLYTSDIENKFGSLVKYDFAWFDLFGNLGMNDIFWLKDSFPANFNKLDLFFTFRFSARGNKTSLVIRDTLWDWYPEEMHETRYSIRPSKALANQKTVVAGMNYDSRALSRSILMDQTIAAHWQLFKYIFNGHSFETKAWVYNDEDSTEMLLYHLNNFKPSDDYEFSDKTYGVIDLLSRYNSNSSDAQIASETDLSKTKIRRWRALNKLPSSEKFNQYRLSVGLESLLLSDAIPDVSSHARLCCARLEEFHSFISDKIACNSRKNQVKISSPMGNYVINIGDNVEYDPNKPKKVTIIPEFLAEPNRNALFSVFRNLFRGDPFLHPQLCNDGYPGCFILSDPQKEAISAWISSYLLNESAGAIVLPTGMGKTIIATHIINWYAQNINPNPKILFFTKYKEILEGAINKFKEHTLFEDDAYYCRFYGGGKQKFDCLLNSPCVFATDASLVKLEKGTNKAKKDSPLLSIPKDHFDIVFADEAHHVNASRWSAVVNRFKGNAAFTIGLTATPYRGDAQDPIKLFDENVISRKNLNRGIWEGYLSWPDYYLYEDRTDYAEVLNTLKEGLGSKAKQKRAADKLKKVHQRKCLSEGFQSIVLDKYLIHARGKKAIGFAPNRACAKAMANYFTEHGIKADYLTAYSKRDDGSVTEYRRRRTKIYKDFIEGDSIKVIFAVDIFNEGVDIPDVEALIKFNRTSSPVKIIQQLGRGLRLAPNKSSVVVLDFVGNYQDLDAFINLGKMTGTNTRLLQRLQRGSSDIVDEDLPIIPASNFHISDAAKFIIKNIVEDSAIVKLSPILEKQIVERCRQGYHFWRIHKEYGATREQAEQLCRNITSSIDENLRDALIRGLRYRELLEGGMHINALSAAMGTTPDEINRAIESISRGKLEKIVAQTGSINTAAGILGLQPLELEDYLAE